MVSDGFRRQLQREAERWQADGLIDAAQYQRLAERYRFDRLETVARDRFIVILISLGSILLGLGIITFVAANWQAIPRELKALLLMSLFVGVNVTGFYLWQQPPLLSGRERGRRRLGQGLLLLGALLLGANMALMGQIFHRSGSAYELCLTWGFGVLLMAYGLRFTPLGILALLLTGIGYWLGVWDLFRVEVLSGLEPVMQYMPLLAGSLFMPLAYWCRSKQIFILGAIAVISSFEMIMVDLGRLPDQALGLVGAIALTLPPALLWSYDGFFWWRLLRRQSPSSVTMEFRPLAQGLALVYLSLLTYILSFHWAWQGRSLPAENQFSESFAAALPLFLNLNLLVLAGLTLLQWFYRVSPSRRSSWHLSRTDGFMLGFLGIIALITFWHWSVQPIQAIATYGFNVLLFLLAAGFMREGLAEGQRRLFWSGLILLTLQILSRMLEYDTGLLLKSLAFLLCGVGVIAVGLWFERYVRTLRPAPTIASSTSEESP